MAVLLVPTQLVPSHKKGAGRAFLPRRPPAPDTPPQASGNLNFHGEDDLVVKPLNCNKALQNCVQKDGD